MLVIESIHARVNSLRPPFNRAVFSCDALCASKRLIFYIIAFNLSLKSVQKLNCELEVSCHQRNSKSAIMLGRDHRISLD